MRLSAFSGAFGWVVLVACAAEAPRDPGEAELLQNAGSAGALALFPRIGDPTDDEALPSGPGLILMGGGRDVDAAFQWARSVIAPTAPARAGDVVVLRATGGDGYTRYLYELADFRSVQTVLVPEGAVPATLDAAAEIVSHAELVFFAGGDQSDYVAWKGTSLAAAVQAVYARGGVIGGTSAGCAILGAAAYDARMQGSSNVTSKVALADPFSPRISFTRDMFSFPALAGAITDTHFVERDRMGRLVAFMARQVTDGALATPEVLGIGVAEASAIVIDAQKRGRLLRQHPSGRAFIVRGGTPEHAAPGAPLEYASLRIFRLEDESATFDFGSWCGALPSYAVSVNGAASAAFSPLSPYESPGAIAACP